MSNLGSGNNSEPSGSAPVAGRWYNLTLGPSFNDNSSKKFCTLRFHYLKNRSYQWVYERMTVVLFCAIDEFKPASIDKSQGGSLHKNKENRVNVEFQNNQPGKPKVTFEGSSEDYKENDGVLFFDGETFRLERLHRAVKSLRHVRIPGESAGASASLASVTPAAAVNAAVTATENRSPSVGKIPKPQTFAKTVANLEVEKIDIGEPDSPGAKPDSRASDHLSAPPKSSLSPKKKISEHDDHFNLIFGDDYETPDQTNGEQSAGVDNNMNIDQNNSDDEIADVDLSDDDEEEKGPNAAEALRAQVNAEEQRQTSSSSRTSGSGSRSSESESGSGTSTSDSEASDDDSASSGGEVQI